MLSNGRQPPDTGSPLQSAYEKTAGGLARLLQRFLSGGRNFTAVKGSVSSDSDP